MSGDRGGASSPGVSTGSGSERDGAALYPSNVTTVEADGRVRSVNGLGSVTDVEKQGFPKITRSGKGSSE